MTRYIVEPHEHGYQVRDMLQGAWCLGTWSQYEATAQRWCNALNRAYTAFMAASRRHLITLSTVGGSHVTH